MRKYLLCLISLIGLAGISQENEAEQKEEEFQAVVINAQSNTPLESVHVI